MKPDKHKQKKNQQYKKSHGIKDGKQTTDLKETPMPKSRNGDRHGVGRDSKSEDVQLFDQTINRTRAEGRNEGNVMKSSLSSSDSEQDREESTGTGKWRTYKRREVTSNWERYDGIREDQTETTAQRGANYKAVVEGTGGSFSQFRFADEKSWDDELSCAADFQSLLSVDPNELAATLDCVPLHKKLNIEESIFQKQDLNHFIEQAAQNKKLYDEKRASEQMCMTSERMDIPSEVSTRAEKPTSVDLTQDILNIMDIECSGSKSNSTKETDFDASENLLTAEFEKDLALYNKENNDVIDNLLAYVQDEPLNSDGHSEATFTKGELDLDDILDITSSKSVEHKTVPPCDQNLKGESQGKVVRKALESPNRTKTIAQSHIKEAPVSNLEDELDMLLDLDDDIKEVNKLATRKNDITETDNDLEDWLDSVLDD